MDLHPKTPWKRFPTLVTRLPRSSNTFHVILIQKIREPILTIPNSHLDAPFFSEGCKRRFFGFSRGFPDCSFYIYIISLSPFHPFLSSTNHVIIKAQQADNSRSFLNRLRDGSSISSSLRSTRRQSTDVSQRRKGGKASFHVSKKVSGERGRAIVRIKRETLMHLSWAGSSLDEARKKRTPSLVVVSTSYFAFPGPVCRVIDQSTLPADANIDSPRLLRINIPPISVAPCRVLRRRIRIPFCSRLSCNPLATGVCLKDRTSTLTARRARDIPAEPFPFESIKHGTCHQQRETRKNNAGKNEEGVVDDAPEDRTVPVGPGWRHYRKRRVPSFPAAEPLRNDRAKWEQQTTRSVVRICGPGYRGFYDFRLRRAVRFRWCVFHGTEAGTGDREERGTAKTRFDYVYETNEDRGNSY